MSKFLEVAFAKRYRASDPMPKNKPFTHVIRKRTDRGDVECGLLANGTFLVVSGPTGVGKSTLMAMLAAATWKGEFGNMIYKGEQGRKRTLWIDTEMPDTDFRYFQRDIVQKLMEVDTEADAFWSINLTWLKEMENKRAVVFELFEALGQGG
jgi:ABC-type phosphate/phosphonate transport system ATPase subunit